MTAYTGTALAYPGFPQWDERDTDPSIILSCELTSAASITDKSGTIAGAGAGSVTYDSGGALLNATAGINFATLTTAQKTAMAKGGTLTCWVEKEYIDTDRVNTSNEYLIGCWTVTRNKYNSVARLNATDYMQLFLDTVSGTTRHRAYGITATKADYVRVDFTSHGPDGGPTMYVDYLPFVTHQAGKWPATAADYDNVLIGGKTTTPTSPPFKVKNLMVSTRPIGSPVSYGLSSVLIFGHSYMSQGDYDANRGYYLAGALSGAAKSGDSGMCAELDRLFRKKGYSAGYGRVRNQSYGGSFLETVNQGLAYQITQSQTNIATAFDKVLIMFGANEGVTSADTFATDYPDWETEYQAHIDTLTTAGVNAILLLNQPYYSENHISASGAAYQGRVDDMNIIIQNLVDANSNCYLVDIWTAFGGAAGPASAHWGGITNDEHPSFSGHKVMAQACFDVLQPLL